MIEHFGTRYILKRLVGLVLRCSNGRLQVVEDSLMNEETNWSIGGHSHDEWEPEWITKRYSQHLSCSDPNCGELCVVIGTSQIEVSDSHGYDGQPEREYINYFLPEFIHPSPSLISPVKETPKIIVDEINSASSLFWTDASSSANKLRLAAERILTALRVKKIYIARRKRKPLTLYARIDLLKERRPDLAKLLHSIRFLGNHGSHESELDVSRDDLLAAFEIIEHVIEEAFCTKAKRIEKAAKAIAKRKGKPAKKPRRRRT